VVKDLVKAPPLIFKLNGGLAEVIHLLLLLAVLALLVLELLLKEGVFGQGFLELHLQPLHHNGVTLLHPLACCGTVDVNHRPVGNPKRKV
jgi:hypothetical protein